MLDHSRDQGRAVHVQHAHLTEFALPELVEELQVLRLDLPLGLDANLRRRARAILNHPRERTFLYPTSP